MKKQQLWFTCLLGSAGLFSSCGDIAKEDLAGGQFPIELIAQKERMTVTRNTEDEKTSWNGDEEISVYDGIVLKTYVVDIEGKLTPKNAENTIYWYTTTENQHLSAWYPSSANVLTTWNVAADQRAIADYKASDLLYASAELSYRGNKNLPFCHKTVKVVIHVKPDGKTVTNESLEGAIVTLENMVLNGTIVNGELKATTPAEGETLNGATVTPHQITPVKDGYKYSVQLLMVPQDMAGKNFFKIVTTDGKVYYYTPNSGEADLKGGHKYTYNVSVGKPGLSVVLEQESVDWGESEEGDITSDELIGQL